MRLRYCLLHICSCSTCRRVFWMWMICLQLNSDMSTIINTLQTSTTDTSTCHMKPVYTVLGKDPWWILCYIRDNHTSYNQHHLIDDQLNKVRHYTAATIAHCGRSLISTIALCHCVSMVVDSDARTYVVNLWIILDSRNLSFKLLLSNVFV